ncbi:MAG: DegT/DnrJ/EryC1/StrS family aminotransferase [Nocardioidaceae bacterium]
MSLLPYGRQSIDAQDVASVLDALESDWLTTGPRVADFEAALARLVGGHPVVTCSSGTAALHTAYAALGVGPGDQVVTTPMTFVATASTATLLGAEVVFADVDPETGLLDPAAAEAALTDRTKVVAAVDYAGHPCDYDRLRAVADRVGARTLADAAHSLGGCRGGRPVGDLADVTTFSFFPTKNLTTAEGGAVVATDPGLAQDAREFHQVGLVRDPGRFRITTEGPWHQEVHAFGLNYRLSDLGAALGLSQLGRLAAFTRRRAELKARYDAALADLDGVATPVQAEGATPAWHLYPVRIRDGRRREVFDRMRAAGIGVQVNYIPVYWHPAYESRGYRRGSCPNAEAFYAEQLSLPMYPGLGDADQDRVVDALAGALR